MCGCVCYPVCGSQVDPALQSFRNSQLLSSALIQQTNTQIPIYTNITQQQCDVRGWWWWWWWVCPASFSPDHVIKAQGCPEGAELLLLVSKTTPLSCWRVCNQRRNLERQTWRGGADSTCSCPPTTRRTGWVTDGNMSKCLSSEEWRYLGDARELGAEFRQHGMLLRLNVHVKLRLDFSVQSVQQDGWKLDCWKNRQHDSRTERRMKIKAHEENLTDLLAEVGLLSPARGFKINDDEICEVLLCKTSRWASDPSMFSWSQSWSDKHTSYCGRTAVARHHRTTDCASGSDPAPWK